MYDRDYEQQQRQPGSPVLGLAALVIGAALGAAALLLTTKPGRRLLEQVGDRTEDWKAQAAAALAETREKVVSSVESEIPVPPAEPGPQVRRNL